MELILRGSPPTNLNGGDVYGDGYGDVYGDGYGYGDASGDGYGYGSGYGYGDGSGSGYGGGSGSGDVYGYGYGYGDASGDGYWMRAAAKFAEKMPTATRAEEEGATVGFWWSDDNGKACNGGKGSPVKAGDVETVNGPLRLCSSRALHATVCPPDWSGERLWLVALHGEIRCEGNKMGALKREILGECPWPPHEQER